MLSLCMVKRGSSFYSWDTSLWLIGWVCCIGRIPMGKCGFSIPRPLFQFYLLLYGYGCPSCDAFHLFFRQPMPQMETGYRGCILPIRPMLSWGKSLQPRGGLRPYVCRDVWIMPSLSLDSLLYFTIWVTLQRLLYARSDHVPYFSRFMLIHHDPFFPIHGLGRMRGIIFGRFTEWYIFLCDSWCFYLWGLCL